MFNILNVAEGTTQEGMDALFTAVSTVVTKVVELMGTVSSALLNNPIFQIVIGVIMFGIGMGVVFTLVRKLKRRGK